MRIYENDGIFGLETMNCSYIIGLADGVYPGLIYYGRKVSGDGIDMDTVLRLKDRPMTPGKLPGEKVSFFDCYPFELPSGGMGDYRESAVRIKNEDGFSACEFKYTGYEIVNGKDGIDGLPATFGRTAPAAGEDRSCDCMSLKLFLSDEVLGVDAVLNYSIFDDSDAIIRSVSLTNNGDKSVLIDRLMSASIDLDEGSELELITMYGSWARERKLDRLSLRHGRQMVSSERGITGHQSQPFMALVRPETTQDMGEVYAMNLIYSGSFVAEAELNQYDSTRMCIGISPESFSWRLEPGQAFSSPEAVLVYSEQGLGKMTREFHSLYKNHLIRSPWLHRDRPILINNWEATYFDFDEEKLLNIARTAKECGIEMLVMDDGWFGHRDADNSSLGDWYVYEKKLPNGLKSLVDKVNDIGLKFGIWMEPEMISPDSDLYRAHPDYALQIANREPSQSRNQYVLDLSRQEVIDEVFDMIEKVLTSANIEYVKWDMNRPLADLGSAKLPPERAGELAHRYVLGVYQLQERLLQRFPDLLLENCAGGGSRFDPGMLYYSPQIWCSDDTDAYERLSIQEGTALVYPVSCIGSHVSICPNHITGRVTPLRMRGDTALSGTFGYELDITKLSLKERQEISDQVKMYKSYSTLIREGEYYRIASGARTGLYDCWQIVSSDKDESLAVYTQIRAVPNSRSRRIRLKGLDEDKVYRVSVIRAADTSDIDPETGEQFSEEELENGRELTDVFEAAGAQLMSIGVYVRAMPGDYRSVRIYAVSPVR
ncbi:MAG: alpha-galactosidase [Eubacterium sp.]|nr:alpha-galactosidase [Eubacterium sp.]